MNKKIISISMGNTKMGPIPSFSLMPVDTCNSCSRCVKSGCYARRLCSIRPCLRSAWEQNTEIVRDDISHGTDNFVTQLNGWLSIYSPVAFRFHVGGDIFNERYLAMLCSIARSHSKVKFFAFTKQFDILRAYTQGNTIPKNFSIILSAWVPGTNEWKPPKDLAKKYPVAWIVKNGIDDVNAIIKAIKSNLNGRIKYDMCLGNCMECAMCFNRKRKDGDIVFRYH